MTEDKTKGLAVNALCPWSGDPVQSDSLARYRGNIVGFCTPGCRDKFIKATGLFDAAIAQSGDAA
ncbi:MAG: glutathione S-transferase [Maricaulis sp.]|nr:glutathione S-transferase [Maricaulis sp.]MDG2043961.1 glutathione S-transferase [Maricaulis sp.]